MERGPISPNTHAAMEPIVALLFVLAPWIFGFSDVTDAKTLSIVVGAIVLAGGMLTQWRYALARVIPLRVHFATDLTIGALLILSPFIFGFSDEGGATRFMIIAGILEIGAALATRWDPAEAITGVPGPGRRSGVTAAR